jgi:L-rhamnose-H+ transport protein
LIPVSPNPVMGVSMHAVGSVFAANCYAPQEYIKRWSWEVFWMTQAVWCWLLWPIIGAALTIPHLTAVLMEAPKSPMLLSFLMGLAYGVGGIAFNLSIRYIGFALTYAIAIGLSAILGTLVPPLVRGQFTEILAKPGAGVVMAGVAVGAIGIALCGAAGRLKEGDLRSKDGNTGEFALGKGLLLSLVAGVLSSVYGFALEAADPIVKVAEQHGAGHWQGNIAYIFANTGAFVTSLIYCLYLGRKNKTLGELTKLSAGESGGSLGLNYLLAFLVGTLWYGQFFFYNLGHVRMGNYAFTSWGIHMIMLVLVSNGLGVLFREWKGCHLRTQLMIGLSLLVLVGSVLLLTYGSYLGEQKAPASQEAEQSTVTDSNEDRRDAYGQKRHTHLDLGYRIDVRLKGHDGRAAHPLRACARQGLCLG